MRGKLHPHGAAGGAGKFLVEFAQMPVLAARGMLALWLGGPSSSAVALRPYSLGGAESARARAAGVAKPGVAKTRAIFFTECEFLPASGWVGRVSSLNAAAPESPCAPCGPCAR